MHKYCKKWDIVLVNLDPVKGREINSLVISPNVMNKHLDTLIVAPLTTSQKNYPSRLRTNFKGKAGEICFDHIKSIDKGRILHVEGTLDNNLRKAVNELLSIMFSEDRVRILAVQIIIMNNLK